MSENKNIQPEGEYGNNVYMKDCPFLLGKENVPFFKMMQQAVEQHTATTPDDFTRIAKMKK